jgi:hypothetical protein
MPLRSARCGLGSVGCRPVRPRSADAGRLVTGSVTGRRLPVSSLSRPQTRVRLGAQVHDGLRGLNGGTAGRSSASRASPRPSRSGASAAGVLLGFVLNLDPTIKMFGLGLAVAVLVDVTIVRLVLVPATMELLGRRQLVAPPLAGSRAAEHPDRGGLGAGTCVQPGRSADGGPHGGLGNLLHLGVEPARRVEYALGRCQPGGYH